MANIHTCTQTDSGIDCTACKLAQICTTQNSSKNEKEAQPTEDDYSISEELTEKGNNLSILYLVLAAAGTLACVILFTKMFMG